VGCRLFIKFLYLLKEKGIPVTPTSFLRLQKALDMGLINSLDDFYTAARAILVKSEKYFDLYDQSFSNYFKDNEFISPDEDDISTLPHEILDAWMNAPEELAQAFNADPDEFSMMSREELVQYFLDRLNDQTEAHHGGSKWIGTGGTSPVGHSGCHAGGMRVGGVSTNKSAVKVAMDRRYRDYSKGGHITESQMGEALKRLRNMIPSGPMDQVNINKTIYQTMKNAGEIEIVFDRSLKNRLKVVLAIDNGGGSMDRYVSIVQTLFNYARSQFKDIKTFYFHNTIYDNLWKDPQRIKRPLPFNELLRLDPETRFIIVGDASMDPAELMATEGAINLKENASKPSIERLNVIAETFSHSIWLNPKLNHEWGWHYTVKAIKKIIPMFELSLDGLEEAVTCLMSKD